MHRCIAGEREARQQVEPRARQACAFKKARAAEGEGGVRDGSRGRCTHRQRDTSLGQLGCHAPERILSAVVSSTLPSPPGRREERPSVELPTTPS